jgi:hypothetical protein
MDEKQLAGVEGVDFKMRCEVIVDEYNEQKLTVAIYNRFGVRIFISYINMDDLNSRKDEQPSDHNQSLF